MPSSNAPQICQTVPDCNKVIQFTFVELENKTKENEQLKKDKDQITGERNQLQTDRETWKNLYLSEREASQKLAASNLNFQTAINGYESQKQLDAKMITAQKRKIRWLKVEKYVYSAGSFGAGFGAGYFYGKNSSRINSLLNRQENSGFSFSF